MRTPEVMRLTLNAAETGHLVLATMHSATCAEALSRMCMSFPAEIQGNIRAQLADCLVGVVCQRLDFLDAYHLRVPRCEVLLASSGAKGTIRSGQFSQIGNVIQSGGDDGMWTFDRYQRWMEQNKDWTRAAPTPAAAEERESPTTTKAVPKSAAHLSSSGSSSGPSPWPSKAPSPSKEAPTDGPIEISIDEDMDLAELAELARRIERRTP
jgi:twitching motility protein PilT